MKHLNQQKKKEQKKNLFDLQRWEPLLEENNIFFNKLNNDQIQYKTIKICQAQEETFKDNLRIRANLNHPYICKLVFFSNTTLPTNRDSGFNDFTIFTDRILGLTHIEWNLEAFSIILKTLIYLSNIYGPFKITESMIFNNQKGELKIWISQNPYQSTPDFPLQSLKQANQCFITLVSVKKQKIADNLKGSKSYQQSYIRLSNIKNDKQNNSMSSDFFKETSSTSISIDYLTPTKLTQNKLLKSDDYIIKSNQRPINRAKNGNILQSFDTSEQKQGKYLINNTSVTHYTVFHEKTLSNIKEDLEKEEIQEEQWQFREKQSLKRPKTYQIFNKETLSKQTINIFNSKQKYSTNNNLKLQKKPYTPKSFKFYNPTFPIPLSKNLSIKTNQATYFLASTSSINQTLRNKNNKQHQTVPSRNSYVNYSCNQSFSNQSSGVNINKTNYHAPFMTINKNASMYTKNEKKEDKQKNVPLFIKQRHTRLVQSQNSFYKAPKEEKTAFSKAFSQTCEQFYTKTKKIQTSPNQSPKKYFEKSPKKNISSQLNIHKRTPVTERRKTLMFASNLNDSCQQAKSIGRPINSPLRNKSLTQKYKSFSSSRFQKLDNNLMNNKSNEKVNVSLFTKKNRSFLANKQNNRAKMMENNFCQQNQIPHLQLNLKTAKTMQILQENVRKGEVQRQIQLFISKETKKQNKTVVKRNQIRKDLQVQLSSILGFNSDEPNSPLSPNSYRKKQEHKNKQQLQKIKQKIIHKKKQFAELKKQAEALL